LIKQLDVVFYKKNYFWCWEPFDAKSCPTGLLQLGPLPLISQWL